MIAPIDDHELESIFKRFESCRGVVLAVSGGADSTALMSLAARWRDRGGPTPLAVATIDHGLRSNSAVECRAVMNAAKSLRLKAHTLVWGGEKPKTRIQERARQARYALLSDWTKSLGWDALATAHTLDDQVETVLMRLMRGSGLDGLAAMRPATMRNGLAHLRPLLALSKARLVKTLRRSGAEWMEDPSNSDAVFERVRVRGLLGLFEEAGLSKQRVDVLAKRAARAVDALDAIAAAMAAQTVEDKGMPLTIEGSFFFTAPAEIRLRLLTRLLTKIAPPRGDRPWTRLDRLEALLEALETAWREGRSLRRTFGGALIVLHSRGVLTVKRENRRRM